MMRINEAETRLWRALRDEVNELRFYPIKHEKIGEDVMQENDVQVKASIAARKRVERT